LWLIQIRTRLVSGPDDYEWIICGGGPPALVDHL
jgi:hypothetical protein